MKRKRRRRKVRYYYFSTYKIKHYLRSKLHRFSKRLFYYWSIIILLIFIFIIVILPNVFNKNSTETVFSASEKPKEIVLNSSNNVIDENENSMLFTTKNKTNTELINTKNVEYKSTDYYKINNHFDDSIDTSKINNLEYLRNNLYIVDQLTEMTQEVFDIEKLLNTDLKLKDNKGPKILIFNTHSSEIYKDSKNSKEGVVGLSFELQRILKEKYGIESIVHEGVYDSVNGKPQILGAYQRMSPEVEKVLEENPSIEVCIDIHRDGIPDDIHLVSDVNGKPTAQIMFVNGLSKVLDENGVLNDATDIPNPNRSDNLAFSLHLKLLANEMYPNFTRKIYLHAYRYSLFMKPKSILVEVGSQTNTVEECMNAMEPLADLLAKTLL